MGMGVRTPGELGRIAGVILGETGERESRPYGKMADQPVIRLEFESRRRKTAQKQSLSGEITHHASATAAPPGLAPGTSWAAFRRQSHSVVLVGNEGGPQGEGESGGRSPLSRGHHGAPVQLIDKTVSFSLVQKGRQDQHWGSWRNCVIALRNEVMLSGLIWQAAIYTTTLI
ncbi:hypothetical protein ASPBRDRAFT_54876 [Aspergillus brasiliensis CBS 101740]|uniref:Uncharacterized protein n=1 Tax=Aspergillus brasiliensis (strain CBS 101740 / IMI 381727 / IBT 21946) TaxID=767769 RepID=A0A1L9UJ38_ASPBC|nr:hypothetical protein ASPBRDRAFT_54876 [Aspergillus brasiliensis CBS 101740]